MNEPSSINADYSETIQQFAEQYDKNPALGAHWGDDAFLEKAIFIFAMETIKNLSGRADLTAVEKASLVLAFELIREPDLKDKHRSTLPYAFRERDARTNGQKRDHIRGAQVAALVQEGSTVEAAFKKIGAKHHLSPSTIRTSYYEFLNFQSKN